MGFFDFLLLNELHVVYKGALQAALQHTLLVNNLGSNDFKSHITLFKIFYVAHLLLKMKTKLNSINNSFDVMMHEEVIFTSINKQCMM